jgi:hypothetical protein
MLNTKSDETIVSEEVVPEVVEEKKEEVVVE